MVRQISSGIDVFHPLCTGSDVLVIGTHRAAASG
jgi:hypothetical protein